MEWMDLLTKSTRSAAFSGIVAGVIVENSDAQKKGLLKVRIPMLEEGEDLLEEVRVMQPYAGKNAGIYFLPEVGDLVLVALVNSNLGRAFVLGGFYPQGGAFSDGCFNEDNNLKTITTRGGTQIAISDEEGKETLTIATPKKLSVTLRDEEETITLNDSKGETALQLDMKNGTAQLQAEKELRLSCGKSSVTLEKGGKITIDGADGMILRGKSIEATAKSKMKLSGQEISAAGQVSVKLEGQSQLSLSSGGITQIKGGVIKLNG